MRPKKYRRTTNHELNKAVRTVDNLTAFQNFADTVLPALRADLAAGMTAPQILEKYQAVAAARLVTQLAQADSPAAALAAANSVLDRVQGKAVERKAITHRLDQVDEREVDALLRTKMKSAGLLDDGEE